MFAPLIGLFAIAGLQPTPQRLECEVMGAQSFMPIQVRDTLGVARSLPDPAKKATVLVFLAVDCPIGNRYAPEIKRIESTYGKKGIGFVHVYPDPAGTAKAVKRHTKSFGFGVPAILDTKLALAASTGATVTPEVAVLGKDGSLLYLGRIDDYNVEHGRARPSYRRDLRVALDQILAGKAVSLPRAAAIGCFIPKG